MFLPAYFQPGALDNRFFSDVTRESPTHRPDTIREDQSNSVRTH